MTQDAARHQAVAAPAVAPSRCFDPWSLLRAATVGALLVLVGVPLLFILLQALFPHLGSGSLAEPFSALLPSLVDKSVAGLLLNTLLLGTCVALASAVFGGALGVIRATIPIPYARVWDIVLLTPFMIPPYISTLGWIVVLQPRGYLHQILGFHLGPFLFSLPGLVCIMACHLFPAVYFAVSRSIASTSGELTEAALMSGATRLQVFRRVTAPLALPAIVGALLLVFAATIEEFGTPAVLASQSHFEVLTTAIDQRVASWPIDLPGASALSLLLVLLALAAFTGQSRLIAGRSYVTISGKMKSQAASARPLAVFGGVTALAIAALITVGVPLFGILATAFTRSFSRGLTTSNFSLRNFELLFSNTGGAVQAMGLSFGLAICAALVTASLGVAAAVLGRRRAAQGFDALGALTALPNAAPGVVIALGLILAWNQPWLPVTLYGTSAMLILAYSCILLPYSARYASAALTQISPDLEAAALMAGASPAIVFRRILLPLIWPSVAAAMMIVFAVSSRELVASILLAPVGAHTMATYVWKQFEQGSLGLGMAMSAVAIAVTTTLMLIATARLPSTERS